ncbi:MAG: endonuclease/exonuclease/phosphatase family protein, partial [Verrucomicrobiota bacterium]
VFANTHFDHRGKTARAESAKLVRNRLPAIAAGVPFVISGDFNCIDGSPPHRTLAEGDNPWVDTFRKLNPEVVPEKEGTFTGFQEKDNQRRIDWILCSPAFTVKKAGIDRYRKDGRLPSDHYPVTAAIEFQ